MAQVRDRQPRINRNVPAGRRIDPVVIHERKASISRDAIPRCLTIRRQHALQVQRRSALMKVPRAVDHSFTRA